ncbi:regulatory protein GemA [Pararhodospirillum photometricum]|uniref:regulatory protein GemA n=1 Tax=Pararhodospirillum photometricum TaxID=1084 RepID=UPI000685E9F0|nr:regulatory protein GemA [Pararhodospirillum photometricum]
MPLSENQNKIIHLAKNKLGLEDEDYRAILKRVAGVDSSRDLDANGFQALMRAFEGLGFVSTAAKRNYGVRPGMASPRQVDLMRALWGEFKGEEANDFTLGRWLEHTFHISSIRFLGYDDARKVIGALKSMKARRTAAQGLQNDEAVKPPPAPRRRKKAAAPSE